MSLISFGYGQLHYIQLVMILIIETWKGLVPSHSQILRLQNAFDKIVHTLNILDERE